MRRQQAAACLAMCAAAASVLGPVNVARRRLETRRALLVKRGLMSEQAASAYASGEHRGAAATGCFRGGHADTGTRSGAEASEAWTASKRAAGAGAAAWPPAAASAAAAQPPSSPSRPRCAEVFRSLHACFFTFFSPQQLRQQSIQNRSFVVSGPCSLASARQWASRAPDDYNQGQRRDEGACGSSGAVEQPQEARVCCTIAALRRAPHAAQHQPLPPGPPCSMAQ